MTSQVRVFLQPGDSGLDDRVYASDPVAAVRVTPRDGITRPQQRMLVRRDMSILLLNECAKGQWSRLLAEGHSSTVSGATDRLRKDRGVHAVMRSRRRLVGTKWRPGPLQSPGRRSGARRGPSSRPRCRAGPPCSPPALDRTRRDDHAARGSRRMSVGSWSPATKTAGLPLKEPPDPDVREVAACRFCPLDFIRSDEARGCRRRRRRHQRQRKRPGIRGCGALHDPGETVDLLTPTLRGLGWSVESALRGTRPPGRGGGGVSDGGTGSLGRNPPRGPGRRNPRRGPGRRNPRRGLGRRTRAWSGGGAGPPRALLRGW